jgi:hypothetical protein
VPVEVGGTYLEEGWGTQMMTLAEYIQHHVSGGGWGVWGQVCGTCSGIVLTRGPQWAMGGAGGLEGAPPSDSITSPCREAG